MGGRKTMHIEGIMINSFSSVWAYRNEEEFGFQWGENRFGYDQLFRFRNMNGLINQLSNAHLRGKVWRLAIVAHGDAGRVQLQENHDDLTAATFSQFSGHFHTLRNYLTRDATLMFVSCIAGNGREGAELLVQISRALPTRYIVGFTQFGKLYAQGLNEPGAVYQSGSPFELFPNPQTQPERLDVDSRFAKIARDGRIIRIVDQGLE
jgi:hypothetical protein